jgi:hypothetical protein
MRFPESWKHWLARSRAWIALAVLGVLFVLPSISNHLILDDHLQALSRLPRSPIPEIPHAPFDLFTFGRPGELNAHFIDRGILLPWWTDPEYLVSFFRPISALTHDLDGLFWPHSPALAHIQTIAWYAFLLVIVACVYRRMIEPPWLASLAFLFYVFDDSHGDAVSWIAARHTIVSTAFGLLAFLAHDRYRRSPGPAIRGWVGPAWFGAGLLAGEGATAALAYLLSYAAFVDTGPRRSRFVSLLPYVVAVIAWRIVYKWRGYGAFASDAYIDASREPIAFFSRMPAAMAVLLQGQLGWIPSDTWASSPGPFGGWVLACAVGLVGMLLVVVTPLLRCDERARFWCASMVGALVPATAGLPSDRSLLFSGVAAMALLTRLFAAVEQGCAPFRGAGFARTVAVVIVIGLLARRVILAPISLPVRARGVAWLGELNDLIAQGEPEMAGIEQRTIIIANPPTIDFASYLLLMRATGGETIPRRIHWFSTGKTDMALTRTSDRSLLVRPSGGFIADCGDRTFRASRRPMKTGETVVLGDTTVTVTEVRPDGNPMAAEFAFREPLESKAYVWRRWTDHRCEPLQLPRVGETVTLPSVDLFKLLRQSD